MSRPSSPLRSPLVLLLILIIAVGGGWWYYHDTHDPATVFNKSLATSLSTSQVEQKTEAEGSAITTDYDFKHAGDPRVAVLLSAGQGQNMSAVKGYGSLQDQYMAYTKSGTAADKLIPATLMDKWVQLRKNGAYLPGANEYIMAASDPRYALFGQFIFGNFSGKTRDDLLSQLRTQPVYSYDAKKVTRTKLNSRDVMVYDVKLNNEHLATFNQKAATAFGLKPADIQLALTGVNSVNEAKLYIEAGSKHLVKVEIQQGPTKVTTTYANYGQVSMIPEPKADLTYQQYLNLIGQK